MSKAGENRKEKKDKLKVSFLFGAGAEVGSNNFYQAGGSRYFYKTVIEPDEAITDALKKKFVNTYFGDCKCTANKIYNKHKVKEILREMFLLYLEGKYRDDNEKEKEEILKELNGDLEKALGILTQDYLDQIKRHLGNDEKIGDFIEGYKEGNFKAVPKTDKDKAFESVELNFEKLIDCLYNVPAGKGQGKNFTVDNEFIRLLIDENQNFKYPLTVAGFFEKYFHTIIDPSKYSCNNFMKIFNYYWSCYFTILEGVFNSLSEGDFNSLPASLGGYSKKRDQGIDVFNCLQNMDSLTEELYSDSTLKELENIGRDSYYHHINKLFEENNEYKCSGVLTSNYYRYVELFKGLVGNDIAYLNGELRLFEYPELLEVLDLSINPEVEGQLYFPFMLGQSMLKPIIDGSQIRAFSKAIEILNKSDVLVILGYNINEDDNHINAIIHEFVVGRRDSAVSEEKSNRQIILMGKNQVEEAEKKLKLEGRGLIHQVEFDYSKVVPEKAVNKLLEKLENII